MESLYKNQRLTWELKKQNPALTDSENKREVSPEGCNEEVMLEYHLLSQSLNFYIFTY